MKICVIGGGASGMTAAIAAASSGATVTILERGPRVGKKILMTGNGKCNLGNLEISGDCYHTDDPSRMDHLLELFGVRDTIAFFRNLGLVTTDKGGYLYPLSGQAASVLDVLRYDLEALNVEVRLNTLVTDVRRVESGFEVTGVESFPEEEKAEKPYRGTFDKVILTCGGKAAPKTGSDGNGYKLAAKLGHTVRSPRPALCALYTEENLKPISGVRVQALLGLICDGEPIASEYGELQLTDYGISGIPVFQLSHEAGRVLEEERELKVLIDCLPGISDEDFENMIATRNLLLAGRTLEEYFTGLLNKKMMLFFLKKAGLNPADRLEDALHYKPAQVRKVWELCREFTVTIKHLADYDASQTSTGGVPLSEVRDSMESLLIPGLFFAGEMLNVDGRCGGYNLQWAWTSGHLAGENAATGTVAYKGFFCDTN